MALKSTIEKAFVMMRDGAKEKSVIKKIKDTQQYIYVLEANITLKNGLTIPLMSEYLYKSHNTLEQDVGKQDSGPQLLSD